MFFDRSVGSLGEGILTVCALIRGVGVLTVDGVGFLGVGVLTRGVDILTVRVLILSKA